MMEIRLTEGINKMKQLKDMPGICKYCVGCLRLEADDFKSVFRCKDFEPNQMNWTELLKEEMRKKNEKDKV